MGSRGLWVGGDLATPNRGGRRAVASRRALRSVGAALSLACGVGFAALPAHADLQEPPAEPAEPGEVQEPSLTPTSRFKKGKNVFEYGDCGATVEVLAPLAVPGRLQDAADQLEVHRMLAVCYVLADRALDAAREFSSLLSINPDHVLDPFLTPPAAIELYERQKADMAAQLAELRKAREQARASGLLDGFNEGGVLVEHTTVIQQVPLAASFLPFGLAQAANGDASRGVLVGAIQGAFLAANVALFWASAAVLVQPRGQRLDTPEKLALYNGLVIGNLAAGVGFAAAYAWGVADALVNKQDVVEHKTSRRALRPEKARDPQDQRSP